MRVKQLRILILTAFIALLVCIQPAYARTPTLTEQDALKSAIDLLEGMAAIGDPMELGDIDYSCIEIGDTVPVYAHYADGEVRQSNEYYPLYYDGRCIGTCLKQLDGSMGFMTGMGNLIQEYHDETGADSVAILYDATGRYFTDGESVTFYAAQPEPERAAALLSAETLSVSQLSALEICDLSETMSTQSDETSRRATSQTRTYFGAICPLTYVHQPTGSKICWAACMSMLYA